MTQGTKISLLPEGDNFEGVIPTVEGGATKKIGKEQVYNSLKPLAEDDFVTKTGDKWNSFNSNTWTFSDVSTIDSGEFHIDGATLDDATYFKIDSISNTDKNYDSIINTIQPRSKIYIDYGNGQYTEFLVLKKYDSGIIPIRYLSGEKAQLSNGLNYQLGISKYRDSKAPNANVWVATSDLSPVEDECNISYTSGKIVALRMGNFVAEENMRIIFDELEVSSKILMKGYNSSGDAIFAIVEIVSKVGVPPGEEYYQFVVSQTSSVDVIFDGAVEFIFSCSAGGANVITTVFPYVFCDTASDVSNNEWLYSYVHSDAGLLGKRSGGNGGFNNVDMSPIIMPSSNSAKIVGAAVRVGYAKSQQNITAGSEVGVGLDITNHQEDSSSVLGTIDNRLTSSSTINAGQTGKIADSEFTPLDIDITGQLNCVGIKVNINSTSATNKLDDYKQIFVDIVVQQTF